jgi:hypothetical protein
MLVAPSRQALQFHPRFRLHSHMIALRQRWTGILGPTSSTRVSPGLVIQDTAPMRSSIAREQVKRTSGQVLPLVIGHSTVWRWEGQRMSTWNYVKVINVEPRDHMRRGSTGEKPNYKWNLTEVGEVARALRSPISVCHLAKRILALRFEPSSMIVFARCASSCKLWTRAHGATLGLSS